MALNPGKDDDALITNTAYMAGAPRALQNSCSGRPRLQL